MAKKASRNTRPRAGGKKRATRRAAAKRTSRPAPRKTTRRASVRRASRPAPPTVQRTGVITHTELASLDPAATRDWCRDVLEWEFGPPMATPSGPYHMWRFPSGMGGGIRANNPPEVPGSIPYVEVASIRDTYARALAHGAQEMLAPEPLPDEMGWIAIVSAPGGVAIGFWAKQ